MRILEGAVTMSMVFSSLAFAEVRVRAFLYNPPPDSVVLTYPYPCDAERYALTPHLAMTGRGLPDGPYQLRYAKEDSVKVLREGALEGTVAGGLLAQEEELDQRYPEAERVRWELSGDSLGSMTGVAALKWSRFHGRVTFRDPSQACDTYIQMHPSAFHAPGRIEIPVAQDGSFDALVPARIYRVMNVNSTGYSYNALERWAWDYDLTHDREDEFVIGRTELYSIRTFEVIGGPRTLFVAFRPTALSRVLRFDADGNGLVEGPEREAMEQALKESYTAIGPELTVDDVKVWIDGELHPVVHLTQIPEYDGDGAYQVQYLLQLWPSGGRLHGASHEIKLEVESVEELGGRQIRDWGQGSVGYYPWGYGQELF